MAVPRKPQRIVRYLHFWDTDGYPQHPYVGCCFTSCFAVWTFLKMPSHSIVRRTLTGTSLDSTFLCPWCPVHLFQLQICVLKENQSVEESLSDWTALSSLWNQADTHISLKFVSLHCSTIPNFLFAQCLLCSNTAHSAPLSGFFLLSFTRKPNHHH